MNEERFEISVNQEDVQNIINCYEKDIEYIKELEDRINKAVEYIENNSLYDEEYDYNYEEEMYLSGIDDEVAKKDLLSLLKGDKE